MQAAKIGEDRVYEGRAEKDRADRTSKISEAEIKMQFNREFIDKQFTDKKVTEKQTKRRSKNYLALLVLAPIAISLIILWSDVQGIQEEVKDIKVRFSQALIENTEAIRELNKILAELSLEVKGLKD